MITESYVFILSVEVLLDMSASGSELGWLTLPYENGVSIYTSLRCWVKTAETIWDQKQQKKIQDSWKFVDLRIQNVSGNNNGDISAL